MVDTYFDALIHTIPNNPIAIGSYTLLRLSYSFYLERKPFRDLGPDGLAGRVDRSSIGGQRRMSPEVMGGTRHQQYRLLRVGRHRHTVRAPGVDLSIGEHDPGGLDVGAAVDAVGEVDLLGHLVRGEAEGLLAQIQVHLGGVQALEAQK